MAQTGLGQGLAVKHDWNQSINQLYKESSMRAEAAVYKQRKAQMYGEMLKKGHVRGEYNTGRLEEHYKDVNGRLADFVSQNPDWETDPGKFAQFRTITDEYLQNDIIQEDVQVQKHFEALQAKAQTETMSPEQIEIEMDKYSSYIQNGGDPYMFINPEQVEFGDIVQDGLKRTGYMDEQQYTVGPAGLPMSRMHKSLDEDKLNDTVRSMMADDAYKREITAEWNSDEGLKARHGSAAEYLKHSINAAASIDNTKWAYDQASLSAYRKGLSESGNLSSFSLPVIDKVISYLETGEGTFNANNNNIAWTDYGDIKKPLMMRDGLGARWDVELDQNGKVLTDSKQAEEARKLIEGLRFNTTSRGAEDIVFVDGMPFVRVAVSVDIPVNTVQDKNGEAVYSYKAENEDLKNRLTAQGFTMPKVKVEGIEQQVGLTGGLMFEKMNGTILMPMKMGAENAHAYDKLAGVGQTSREGLSGGQYQAAENLAGAVQKLNKIAVGENKKDKNGEFNWRPTSDGRVVSEDGRYEIDLSSYSEDTNDYAIKEVINE